MVISKQQLIMSLKIQKCDMQAVILVGGLGKRLRTIINDRPKPMAQIRGKPFLEYQINYLKSQNVTDIVLLCGYMANKIREYFKDGKAYHVNIKYVIEQEPLGTGGAITNALNELDPTFLLLNGDTFIRFDLKEMIKFHKEKKSMITILITSIIKRENRYGQVMINSDNKVVGFVEKQLEPNKKSYTNCGVYIINKNIFLKTDHRNFQEKFSFEKDFLNTYYDKIPTYAFTTKNNFIDIGTPESYEEFCNFADKNLQTRFNKF